MKDPRHSHANQTLSVMTFDVIRVLEGDVNMAMAWPQPTPPPQARRSPQNNRPTCAFLRSQVLSARVARPEFRTPAALTRQPYRQARFERAPKSLQQPEIP
jgi:hypothetical protein